MEETPFKTSLEKYGITLSDYEYSHPKRQTFDGPSASKKIEGYNLIELTPTQLVERMLTEPFANIQINIKYDRMKKYMEMCLELLEKDSRYDDYKIKYKATHVFCIESKKNASDTRRMTMYQENEY